MKIPRRGQVMTICGITGKLHEMKSSKLYWQLRYRDKETGLIRTPYVHRLVWQEAHGPIPKGKCITFSDGNPSNFELANLELSDHSWTTQSAKQGGRTKSETASIRRSLRNEGAQRLANIAVLLGQGLCPAHLAKELDISRERVRQILNKAGVEVHAVYVLRPRPEHQRREDNESK